MKAEGPGRMRGILEIGSKIPKLLSVWQMYVQFLYKSEIQKRVESKFLAVLPKSTFTFEKNNDEAWF